MKDFLRRGGLFCAILLAILLGLESVLAMSLRSPEALKLQALFSGQRHAQIIMGTSHAVYGINPALLGTEGQPVYNFAFNGSNPVFYERWYGQVYKRYQAPPRLVLLSVDWFAFKDYHRRKIEHDSKYFPLPLFWDLAFDPQSSLPHLVGFRFTLVKERHSLQRLLFREADVRHDMTRYAFGYVPYDRQTTGSPTGSPYPPRPVDPHYQAKFEALVASLKRDGAKVVFVQTPEYLPVSGSHADDNRRIAAIARSHDIPFLNYNEELASSLNYDASLYYDWGHLNEAGCRRFSRELGARLRALGLVSPS